MSSQWLPGPEGEPGPPGKAGKSAFQIARDLGFRGTERQWLDSLKGIPGESVRGPKGDPGLPGKDAIAPQPQFPLRAEFERDQVTKLTDRMLVHFPAGTIEVVPIREDGFMTSAEFYSFPT